MEETQPVPTLAAPLADAPVLFVDLDGSLVKTDLLHEAILSLARHAPLKLLKAAGALHHGKAAFKQAVSECHQPDVAHLPWRQEALDLVAEERARGCKIVLATATHRAWAKLVVNECGLFDDLLASDGERNLKGRQKLAAIEDYCRKHGHAGFSYLGDSGADVVVWQKSRVAYLAAPSSSLWSRAAGQGRTVAAVGSRAPRLKALARLLRPHQWAKNLLLAVPLITSHRVLEVPLLVAVVLAMICFSLCASAVYVLNDLFDLDSDRVHPTKRNRPFASGAIPIHWGPPLVVLLGGAGLLLSSLALPEPFVGILVLYGVATCAYSLALKRVAMLDVTVLASLYTLRVLAGGLATGIPVSEWLMAFSLFMFVSLAFAKRYTELDRAEDDVGQLPGRGYRRHDLGLVETLGPSSGLLAVLVLVLYLQSDEMQERYQQAWALWLLCPLLLYWISRLWLKARRQQLHDDPVVFALRDPVSLGIALAAGLLLVAAASKL
jgi:4-hydroxybenzoate polyprenyltransferase/phosphoserine phosphatase